MRDFLDTLELLLEAAVAFILGTLLLFVAAAFGLLVILAVWKSVFG